MFVILMSLPFIAVAAIVLIHCVMHPSEEDRLHTFVVDPLTMIAVGALAGLVGLLRPKGARMEWREFQMRRRVIDALLVAFLVVFWTMEVLTYFNVMGHPFKPGHTGNDFMWNGYLDFFMDPIVDTTVPTYRSGRMNLLALVLFLAQAWFLSLGRRLGYRFALDNRNKKKA